MKRNEEYGLIIIWENARYCEKKIINDLEKRFKLINRFEIEWNKKLFSENLTRFYGENLPRNSFKEKHCGNGKFLLLILQDKNPLYCYRRTSAGKKNVNVNFFDSKEMYRLWTGGGHMIHATNDIKEFKHDLMLLLGLNINDYEKCYKESEDLIKIKKDIVGSDGWESLEQVLYVLNDTADYVVLRNFQELPEIYEIGNHGDIDILSDNIYNIAMILKAKKEHLNKSRVRHIININNKNVYMDFRYLADNYYELNWEKNILINKIMYKNFYIPCNEDYDYSLLYHALVHKKIISDDYFKFFEQKFKTNDIKELENILKDYMEKQNYKFMEPKDISVFYNYNITNQKMALYKRIYFRFYFIFKIIDKIKNYLN